jgi:hypothetical protein
MVLTKYLIMTTMATLRFRALIKIHGVNPYVLVSAKRASGLKPDSRKPMPVLVRINPFDSFAMLSRSGQAPFGPRFVTPSRASSWPINTMALATAVFAYS